MVPNWRANDALGHVGQRKLKFGGPVCHLLSSLAILYCVIAQLQRAPLPNLSLNHSLTVHPDPKKADEVSIGYDHTADYTG